MKYCDFNGEMVEIPTFEEDENGEYLKVQTIGDMEILIKAMGFLSIQDFNQECEKPAEELVGKFFCIMGKAAGRFHKQPVFLKDETETLQDKLNRGV